MRTRDRVSSPVKASLAIASVFVVMLFFSLFNLPSHDATLSPLSSMQIRHKPDNINIKGVMFYGRRQFVDILDCYLQRNLAINGGYLDEMMFVVHTDVTQDLGYLQDLVARVPQYKYIELELHDENAGYGPLYETLRENNTIYIKIDDDLVWIDDDAVPRIVHTLIEHPEAHAIGGNIINSAHASWIHYHNDAIYPYLPEPEPQSQQQEVTDWRASKLPKYPHNVHGHYDFSGADDKWDQGDRLIPVGSLGGPPSVNHRWLPLTPASQNLQMTPIRGVEYHEFGRGWRNWAIGAQQLYSHLENLEKDQLEKYWFGSGEGVWNMHYQRLNVNFLAIWGSSIAMQLPGGDDEYDLTVRIPEKFGRCEFKTHFLLMHATPLTLHSCTD